MSTVRWNLAVSAEIDQSLRLFLVNNSGGKKGDISKFVEEAVRMRIFDLTTAQVKQATIDMTDSELTSIINEAVTWARK